MYVRMYVCVCVCVGVSFGFSPFSLLCQNYDKIMRPFLRKNIKTKTKAIEIIYVHTYVFVCVRAYSMSVSMHVLVGPHVRPDTVTPALPLRCRRRTHCRISFEDDARSLRCQTFWLARANWLLCRRVSGGGERSEEHARGARIHN